MQKNKGKPDKVVKIRTGEEDFAGLQDVEKSGQVIVSLSFLYRFSKMNMKQLRNKLKAR